MTAGRRAAVPTRPPQPGKRPPADGGSATIELALCLPIVLAVFAACLAGLACLTAQLRCVDAAREAARQLARGDDAAAARAVAVVADGASMAVERTADTVTVRVRDRPIELLPGIEIEGVAVAAMEPT